MSRKQRAFLRARRIRRCCAAGAAALVLLFSVGVTVNERRSPASALSWYSVFRFFGLTDRVQTPAPCTVRVLPVGEGDCILIQTAEAAVLIDTGTGVAAARTAATLVRWGVRQLDAVFFTHYHDDHTGGAEAIFAAVKPMLAVLGYRDGPDETAPAYHSMIRLAKNAGAAIRIAQTGERYDFGALHMDVLSEGEGLSGENNRSLILRVTFGSVSMLLLGDAEDAAEQALLASGETLSAQWIKLGHHGSATSTSKALLDAVEPAYAALSCGRDNPPAESVLQLLTGQGIRYARTDLQGTVCFTTDGTRYSMFTENS